MKTVRCIHSISVFEDGKEYKLVRESKEYYTILDFQNDKILCPKKYFSLPIEKNL